MSKLINLKEMKAEKNKVEFEISSMLNQFKSKYKINITKVRMMIHQETGRILGIEIKLDI